MILAKDLPLVQGDRVQLLQVMDSLLINAIEAMSPHAAGARDLLIRTVKTKSGSVLVAVCDSGPGVDPANLERIFDAYFTTKADGLGMGLSIDATERGFFRGNQQDRHQAAAEASVESNLALP